MANTISKAFVQQFQDNLIHLAQQKGSRLRSAINEQSVTGEKFNFDLKDSIVKVEQIKTTPLNQRSKDETLKLIESPQFNVPFSLPFLGDIRP